ncbi:DUF2029 domain-containing protein [bacterium]|nr:MAG: DUF2029 domain-containing protein [bacterium]
MNHPTSPSTRPPLWLASLAVAAAWGALYDIARLVYLYVIFPIHEDVRIFYVAAEAGLRYGWSTIYDVPTLRALSASFPPPETKIDSGATYIHPPLLAWLFVPLTALPEQTAYLVWSVLCLGALVWAWYMCAPYQGIARFSLLLLALALWPVMECFYWGQPTIPLLALVVAAWWFAARDKAPAAAAALALATALKPQAVIMVPLALLAAGRYRIFFGWAAGCTLLAAASAINLGPSGLASYWHALKYVQADTGHAYFTLAFLFGMSPLTYALLLLQGLAAMVVARVRRAELDVVFAVGLLGSLVTGFHLHQPDYASLAVAGWLVLRTSPPLWHRLFLLAGVLTLQLLTTGAVVPQLVWDVAWLGILAFSNSAGSAASALAIRPAAVSAARVGT